MFGLMPLRKERTTRALLPEAAPFALMPRDFDTLFDRFFGRWPLDIAEFPDYPLRGLKTEETDKELVVRVEVPGFELSELEVQLLDEALLITAAHKPVKGKEAEGKVGDRETGPAEMKRYLTIPPGIDPAKVEAFCRNGVLEVHLPKTAAAAGRRIEIKT